MAIVQEAITDQSLRRRFPRRQFHHRLGFLFRGVYTIIHAREIGEGGMLVETDLPLVVGEKAVIAFFIQQNFFTMVTTEVLYKAQDPKISESNGIRRMQQYGVRFTALSFEAKRTIRDYIAEKSSIEAKLEKN
jgi:hypothetical protein